MKATLILHTKAVYDDGSIVEMRVWAVPMQVQGSGHGFKYSLFYGRDGRRIVGYDNEAGKGDHRHLDGDETAYSFSTIEQLIEDFKADVRRRRAN
ncbi:hypothetical protein WV31_02630 [Magnetospirillum sp. ME-1]|uniref:Uncharacterized protein n=1 Tax=Paramagnetospirillum marisnigri TaxID=1285242 RepID=A0A178MHT1_9PROT|nr:MULTISPECIES: DUF6516 family protein [Rhodospirillales]ARJ64644.1 hypothetical protein WV31_02630 [Magnetospirillum sp. ME-1]OAN48190.1 hypothetical protein A6A04_05435 [Paramagnetospirillum marisnigri]